MKRRNLRSIFRFLYGVLCALGFVILLPASKSIANETSSLPPCTRNGLTLTTTPAAPQPVTAHTTVIYDVALINHDAGACASRTVIFQPDPAPPAFTMFGDPTNTAIGPGETVRFTVSVTATSESDAGTHSLPFRVADISSGDAAPGLIKYTLASPNACAVRPDRELMILDPSVVDDPLRTIAVSADARSGAWSFGRLMERIAPTPAAAPAMVERFFQIWLSDQNINSFMVPARPGIRSLVLETWPRTAEGELDLGRAPLRLLAIVNRMDLRTMQNKGAAGEGRFVFGVLDRYGNAVPFTIIFEYRLPAVTQADVLAWARAWHALGELPFPGEHYNAALQALTDRFTARGRNTPMLNTIRSNEAALNTIWELREFRPTADGSIRQVPVESTPDTGYIADSPVIADYVNTNTVAIMRDAHVVPQKFKEAALLGGAALNNLVAWSAPGILDAEARHHFSVNTCNGCHGSRETHTEFLHISPRNAGAAAALSAFLRGIAVHDPVSGKLRILNELGRRKLELERLVCGGSH